MSRTSRARPPHYLWNAIAFVVDYGSFGIALTFVSLSSVMPAFVGLLTDAAPLIGLASTVFNAGWTLPQLAVARIVRDKPRKKPYLLAGLVGRVAPWIIAAALWRGTAQRPDTMLIVLYVCLAGFALSDGVSSLPWYDILARSIPVDRRGRVIGMGQAITGLGGAGVGVLVSLILARLTFPYNYALLFALWGVFLIPSTVAVALLRELPPEHEIEHQGTRQRAWLKPLATDSTFRLLMACRIVTSIAALATPFYVIHARDVLHAPDSIIGVFVGAQTITSVVGSVVLGMVSERYGSQAVIRVGSIAAVAGPLLALATDLTGQMLAQVYPLVFVTIGITQGTMMLGFSNYTLEIAPPDMVTTYIGTSNTIMGLLSLMPVIGGLLLERTSYTALFGTAIAVAAVSLLLSLRLPPHHTLARPAEGVT